MIDRSKPLPIHEFPNLIDEVARLKELENAARADVWSLGKRQWLGEELCDAAPALLDVLGEIRAGDAEIIGLFVEFMEKHKPDGHLNDTGPGAKITNAKATACLRRYRDMANKMEENR
jgi:hypothetical protein